jgi:hypothetical protein
MAKKIPYNTMTCEKMTGMGRDYWKVEYLNPFHIIKERDQLRLFRDSVKDFCEIALRTDNIEQLKKWIVVLQERVSVQGNNKYFPGQKNDCFHFFDYLAICPVSGIVAIQSTSYACHAEHRKKILRNEHALRWVSWAKIELWSWKNTLGNKTAKAKGWVPRIEEITREMFVEFAKKAR